MLDSTLGLVCCWMVILGCGCDSEAPPASMAGGAGAQPVTGVSGMVAATSGGPVEAAAGGAGASAAGSGNAGASAGASAAGMSAAIDAWPAAANCGALGQDCSLGCDAPTSCLIGTDICVPAVKSSFLCTPGTCADSAPFCIARLCLTEQQAACVCSAADAKMRVDTCASPAAARGPANACIAEQGICATATNKCCPGLICLQMPDVVAQCWQPCTSAAECSSGCCTMVAGQKICAPKGTC